MEDTWEKGNVIGWEGDEWRIGVREREVEGGAGDVIGEGECDRSGRR
jgi:hypothetical protein